MAMAEAFLSGAHEAGRDHRADAEEGAVRERGEDARGHQRPVVGASAQARLPSVKIAISASSTVLRGQRPVAMVSSGAPTTTPERIAGDQQAGGGDGDVEIGADLEQQAHDDEFGDADAEGTGGEGIESKGHDDLPVD